MLSNLPFFPAAGSCARTLQRWGVGASLVVACLASAGRAGAVASAELYQSQAELYGRFEARLRFPPGDGVVGSFFLWKSGSETSGAYWNELDFEKIGADCRLQTNAPYGAPVAQHTQMATPSGNLCAEYHTYGFEWTPTYIAFQIDGAEVRRETGDTANAFAQNATAGMQIHFNIWPGDASFGGNFNPSILPVQQYISWVQYSSYADGAFTQKWREEFDGSTLPSDWSTGNWASPKNLSTHSPANVTFAGGISVLSLTADNATGFTGMPPVDPAAVGTGGAGTAGAGTGGQGGSAAGAANAGTAGAAPVAGAGAGGTGPGSGAGGAGPSAGGTAPNQGGSTSITGGTAGAPSAAAGGTTSPNAGTGGGGTGAVTSAGGSGPSGGDTGAGTSGQAAAGAPTGQAGTASDSSSDSTSSGCGCRVPSRSAPFGREVALALAAAMWWVRRRRSKTLE